MTGRNDPCPCGSGKKYKQCCMLKQSEELTLQAKGRHFFDRKYKLTKELYAFMSKNLGGDWHFDHEKYRPFDPVIGSFREGAGDMWAYFFRVYENGMRGIEWFMEERGQRYSGEERKMLDNWIDMRPSCYQLVDHYELGTIIEDIWTKERYKMPYNETMIKMPPWTVGIAMLEPFVEEWCIHGVAMWGHPDIAPEIIARVSQLQEEQAEASGQESSPADILASHYPELLELCQRISRKDHAVHNRKDLVEQVLVTREYTCESPGLLIQMLLDIGDGYTIAPGTVSTETTTTMNLIDKLDGLLGSIPEERRQQLRLDEIELSSDLATIVIDKQEVTASGWQSDELEAMLVLLDTKLSAATGLTLVNERREVSQIPKDYTTRGYNIVADQELPEQETYAYGNLPMLLQWVLDTQSKSPEVSAEDLLRGREYDYRSTPESSALNLVRIALGLPESPFADY